ncbi:MAG TPA: YkgJ family cysteine cluster protein [Tenuifilaceae bacterium]|nr:YkgJ family cysteine cluster protein [Tenuifilaceae bacterium]
MDSEDFNPTRLKELANSLAGENRNLFKQLKRMDARKVDELFHSAHAEEYEKFDCLACANCCRTISPIITYNDVERIAKALRLKPSVVVEKYLEVDSDGDYVFRSSPCPFILPDNYCSIYDSRPKACREYPHTDRKRMHQIFSITQKNISICPIVFNVVERIKKEIEQ